MKKNFVLSAILMLIALNVFADQPIEFLESQNTDVIEEDAKVREEEFAKVDYEIPPVPAVEHKFVGVKKCSMCHKSKKRGGQFAIWKETKHAHAYETLGTPKAKELGASLGVDDPQTSGKCLKCHSTAYWFGEEKITDAIDVQESISCETCHGPGKDYMKMKVMKDHVQAVANGLLLPDENTCRLCHNETAPAPPPREFNFEEFSKEIRHPIPEK